MAHTQTIFPLTFWSERWSAFIACVLSERCCQSSFLGIANICLHRWSAFHLCVSIIFIGSLLSLTFAWNGIPKVIHVEQVTFLKKNRVHSMPVITRHYSLNTKQQTTNHNFKTANSNCCPLTRAAACFDYHVQRCSLTLSSFLHLTNQHLVTFHFRFTSVILGLLLCAQILCLCTMPLRRLFALLYFHVCIHAHCPLCLIS